MNYEEIVAGFRALQASDFDYKNINPCGWERLAELTDALMSVPVRKRRLPRCLT
jgi:hypothetical protein